MKLGYERKERILESFVLERVDIDFRKSDENLIICGSTGMGKSELVKREITELCELGENILVFADNPEEYRNFNGIKQYSLSQLENGTGSIKNDIYNKERDKTLYIYIDSLDNSSLRQLNEIECLFALSRVHRLVVSATCCNHKQVMNFNALLRLSKHFLQLPYNEENLPENDLFTTDEKEYIAFRHGRDIKEIKTLNNRLIYKKTIDIGKIETVLVTDVFE